MTEDEDLISQTLARAAQSVAPLPGLAERSLATARRMRTRRRSAAALSVAACAIAAVTVASLLGGVGDREVAPVAPTTDAPLPSVTQSPSLASSLPDPSSTSPSVSPTISSPTSTPPAEPAITTKEELSSLGVLVGSGTQIFDGGKTIQLHPLPPGGWQITALGRDSSGYAVSMGGSVGGSSERLIAQVGPDGSVSIIDRLTTSDWPRGIAVSPDGKTIAFATLIGFQYQSTQHYTLLNLVDTTGQLVAKKKIDGYFEPVAVDNAQVWLILAANGVDAPDPTLWDRISDTTQHLDFGRPGEADLRSVDLRHGLAVFAVGACGTEIVRTSAPQTPIARNCGTGEPLSFSPDGTYVTVGALPPEHLIEILATKDGRVIRTTKLGVYGWTKRGTLVCRESGGLRDFDPRTGKSRFFPTAKWRPGDSDIVVANQP